MDYVIIGLLVLIIILVIVSIVKNINEAKITERLGKLETTLIKELSDYRESINRTMNNDFNNLNEKIEVKLRLINEKVSERTVSYTHLTLPTT